MANLRFLRRVEQNFGQRVADLFGVPYSPVGVAVQRGLTASSGDGRVAQGGSGNILFDRAWLHSASRADVRGAVIHELTHALGVGARFPKNAETYADYARYVLNPKEASYWAPSKAVLAMAEKRGDVTAPNRPASGRQPNRKRAASTDQRSGNNGNNPTTPPYTGAPPLPPGQSAAFTAQLAAQQQAYTNALAAIRAQGGQIRGQYTSALGDIRAQRVQGAVDSEANALQRGIVGSSADLTQRAGVVTAAAGARVDARSARNNALAQLRVAEMQAGTDYSMGVANVLADKAAAQAELANQRFMNDLVANSQADYQALYEDALKRLLAAGKNPAGVDPRAGSRVPPVPLVQPYGGPFTGKVEPRGLYYPSLVPRDLATGATGYGGVYAGKVGF